MNQFNGFLHDTVRAQYLPAELENHRAMGNPVSNEEIDAAYGAAEMAVRLTLLIRDVPELRAEAQRLSNSLNFTPELEEVLGL